ncbi:OmpP1/FadL family transporter [Albibacterium bauzanense]|uniref:Long-chain fatty acid transport protein n=1 Tax=Albibacterium bauzanense TaxID=653929 RepID=A0A4R1LNU6_9SPHI|nr:outer membrane protein transport protein [Albibacterium bauzanense]TCK80728.1 long-chain fatty acid transport protein [Albibacterium bauzanense]
MKKLILALFLCSPALLFAQSFQVNLQGVKQSAMAGAGAALILDESTVFFNPGAMSLVHENSVSVGMYAAMFRPSFKADGSTDTEHVKNKIATPFAAYALWGPDQAKWKVGLGIYTPFGGLVEWDKSWSGKYSLTSVDLKAIYFQPTFSYRITENFGIGLGLIYNYGEVDLRQAIPLVLSDGSDANAQLTGTGKGYGWNAGLYYKTQNGISIALVHHSKVTTKLKNGDAIFNVPEPYKPVFPEGNTFDSEIPLPSTTTLALGIPVSERTSIAIDGSFVNWKVYKELVFDYSMNTPALQDTRSERNYGNGGSIKLGVQHYTTDKLTLRAGTAYLFTPVKDGYVTPDAPDSDAIVLSAGFGYKASPNWEINANMMYGNNQSRTGDLNSETGIPETYKSGTYKIHAFSPGLSVAYRW